MGARPRRGLPLGATRAMSDAELKAINALVGDWTTRATHPAFADAVGGRATFQWLEREQFLIQRSWTEHPDVPDGIGSTAPRTTATACRSATSTRAGCTASTP